MKLLIKLSYIFLVAGVFALTACQEEEKEESIKTKLIGFGVNLGQFHDGPVTFEIQGVGTKKVENHKTVYWSVEYGNYTIVTSGTGFTGITANITVEYSSPGDYILIGGTKLGDWPRFTSY